MAKRDNGGRGRSQVGLALAGGGLAGAVYEIGALRALDEALDGVDFTDLNAYVGVSAGSFLAANLANGLTTAQMCRAIVKHDHGEHPFRPETFLTPAIGEMALRSSRVPKLIWDSWLEFVANPGDLGLLNSLLTRLGRALPVGVFDNRPIREYLNKIYSMRGRTDDFRKLDKNLFVIATDLDSGVAVRFGSEGEDHVPISVAVQASTALPGLYPPVEIDERYFVDGVLRKTMHASVALDEGCDLVLCVNPIVPVDTARAVERGIMKRGKLIDRGLPTVLSQTLRTIIYSRLKTGFATYENRFGDADVVLFEPRRDDYRMFFTNIFSFSSRRDVCEHAYRATRRELFARREELVPLLGRHGITLRLDLLAEETDLWASVGLAEKPDADGEFESLESGATNDVLSDLDRALDRLDKLVEAE